MVKFSNTGFRSLLLLANAVVLTIVINQLSALFFLRFDLTEEGRYSIKPQTDRLLRSLDEGVFVEVFLEGDLNPGFTRFKKSVQETLEEFSVRSGGKVTYIFTDPLQAKSEKSRNEFMAGLVDKGLKPLNIVEEKDGRRSEKIVFPGAVISYAGIEKSVNLLKNSSNLQGAQAALNQSIETIEYELASGIASLAGSETKRVAWIKGHGELDSLPVAGIQNAMVERFELFKVDLAGTSSLDDFDLVVIARPVLPWSPEDLYKLDQFIMRGGKVIFFLDNLEFDLDLISESEDFGKPLAHGLDALLFRYGLRINQDLIQDLSALPVPVVTGTSGGKSQITPIPWPFYPMAVRYAEHPATRNLDASMFRFVSTMDTIRTSGVKKIPLVFSSPYTRILNSPVKVSIADLRKKIDPAQYRNGEIPLAWLLEGKFQSLFKNRLQPEGAGLPDKIDDGSFSRIVVFSDGDFLTSGVDKRSGEVFPAGYDSFTRQTFANQELVLNLMDYLSDDQGIINARNKKVTVRLLDKEKISEERNMIRWINLGVPVLIMILTGIILSWLRYRRYAHF